MPPDEVKEWLTQWHKRGFMHTMQTLEMSRLRRFLLTAVKLSSRKTC